MLLQFFFNIYLFQTINNFTCVLLKIEFSQVKPIRAMSKEYDSCLVSIGTTNYQSVFKSQIKLLKQVLVRTCIMFLLSMRYAVTNRYIYLFEKILVLLKSLNSIYNIIRIYLFTQFYKLKKKNMFKIFNHWIAIVSSYDILTKP